MTVPAVLGSARLNNFRLAYMPADLYRQRIGKVIIWLGGEMASGRVRRGRLTIRDVLNDAPNTCALVVEGAAPTPGLNLRVMVNSNDPHLLFNGTLQTVDNTYEGKPNQLAWTCNAVDDTARANQKRPFGNWVDTSATVIAQQLTALFAPGMTAHHVQANLPIASITFDGTETFGAAMKRLANLIGGYHYIEDLDVHLFVTEDTDAPDDIDTTPGRFLNSPPIAINVDDSQLHTRVYGKGHGEAALVDVAPGADILPIADAIMFNALGGRAIAGTTPDGAQSQRLEYTGKQSGGVGSLVGPGVAPSAALTPELTSAAGLPPGLYRSAYTWVTAAGETAPAPLAAITTGVFAPPFNVAPGPSGPSAGGNLGIGIYKYAFTYVTATGETTPSIVTTCGLPTTPGNQTWFVMFIATGPPTTIARKLYRSAANGTQLRLLTTINNNTQTNYNDQAPDSALGVNAPTVNTAAAASNAVALSNVAVGPSGTTARKIYRTVAGGSQLKLQQTIANNAATVAVDDATLDGALGANAPVGDTSGLSTVTGQVNAGAVSVLTASAAPFVATGGYVILPGGQVVRYTGIAGNTLTGVPAIGPGAIVTTVPYGASIVAAPALTGVTGIVQPILRGAAVCIWVQRDNLPAQAARAAIDAAQGRVSDGVIEHTLTDERRAEPSLIALCDADLALFAYPIVTVTYDSRDLKTKSGKPITFNLPSPPIADTLTIQDVTITEIDIAAGLLPRFHVSASSVRYSLEDLLRQLLTEASAT